MGRRRLFKISLISLIYATTAVVMCHVVAAAESQGNGQTQLPSTLPLLPIHQYVSTEGCENDLNQMKSAMNRMWISVTQWAQNSEKISKIEQLLLQDLKKCSNPCNPNPCLNGVSCQPTPAGNDYVCGNCPLGTGGKNCENVACNAETKCLQFRDKMYFVLEEHGNWVDAYNKCISRGLRMAMPKEQETTSYLIYELRFRYPQSTNTHFWIGLKPYGNDWRWNDGTPLGDYTGNVPNFKTALGDKWAVIWLTGGDVWWYPQVFIPSAAGGLYYPLCEKIVSTKPILY